MYHHPPNAEHDQIFTHNDLAAFGTEGRKYRLLLFIYKIFCGTVLQALKQYAAEE